MHQALLSLAFHVVTPATEKKPFCSLLPPAENTQCPLTLELDEHRNLAWFLTRNTNSAISHLSRGGEVPQENWTQPYS